jgi:hypothetical protein
MYDSIRNLSASLLETAMKDGQDLKDAGPYTNYAVYGTPVEKIYGKNLSGCVRSRRSMIPSMSWISLAGSSFEQAGY